MLRDEINGKLQIHFIDVGQGDAALLLLPSGERIMVDTGTQESGEAILAHLAKWGIEYIDYVILSHTHADHAGGLSLLEESIGVGIVLYEGIAPSAYDGSLQELCAGDTFTIGDVQFSVLGPLGEEDAENRSMVLRVDYGEISLLFTGDTEANAEELLCSMTADLLDVDLLKVSHHGSDTSTSTAFLDAVTPQIAVISASADNRYGHPSPGVLDRLSQRDCEVLITHQVGTIVFLSDGKELTQFSRNRWF